MSDQDEFDGDACVVLPKNYLNSAAAVSEIYEAQLSAVATNFEVDQMSRPGFFKGTLLATGLWLLSGVFSVCL
jgi:hypothetical protein